jgi:hypothetical protein
MRISRDPVAFPLLLATAKRIAGFGEVPGGTASAASEPGEIRPVTAAAFAAGETSCIDVTVEPTVN